MPSNQLNTFKILFLIKGILFLLLAFFFLLYIGFGFFMHASMAQSGEMQGMPFNPGSIFIILGGFGIFFSIIFGILTLLASKYLKEQRNYTFIFVIAILNCLTGILGILLGVFTIIELNKPHVKILFDTPKS